MPEHTPHSEPTPGHAASEETGSVEAVESAHAGAGGEPINDLSQASYQPEGVPAGRLIGLIGMTLVCIAASVLALYFVFYAPFRDHRQQLAEDVNPNVEQVELRAQAVEALETYGLTADSSYRIPVTEAMRKQAVRDSAAERIGAVETRSFFNTGWVTLNPTPATISEEDREIVAGEADERELSESINVSDSAPGGEDSEPGEE